MTGDHHGGIRGEIRPVLGHTTTTVRWSRSLTLFFYLRHRRLTHLLTHSLTYSLTYSLTHSLTDSSTREMTAIALKETYAVFVWWGWCWSTLSLCPLSLSTLLYPPT